MTSADWARSFDAFVRRKEREAREARIEGVLTLDDGTDAFAMEAVGTPWTRECFDGWFYWSPREDGRSVNLVFVRSREGNTVAEDPAALGGGDTDKHLIYEGLSRVHVDAVLAGGRTVGHSMLIFSVWHPEMVRLRRALGKPRHPTQIVVSAGASLGIVDELVFNVPDVPCVLITTEAGAASRSEPLRMRPWVRVLTTGRSIDLRQALDTLAREHDLRLISCIGGRTTARALLDARLLEDLYLTTSPASGGTANTPLHLDASLTRPVLRKRGKGREAGVLFEHFRWSET